MQGSLIGQTPSLTIAGRVLTDLDNLKVLYGASQSASSFFWCTPREGFSSSGYQVPVGKIFRIVAITSVLTGSITPIINSESQVFYGDTDVGMYSNAASSSPQYLAGASTAGSHFYHGTAKDIREAPVMADIPAGKYVCCYSAAIGAQFHKVYGYELDA